MKTPENKLPLENTTNQKPKVDVGEYFAENKEEVVQNGIEEVLKKSHQVSQQENKNQDQ